MHVTWIQKVQAQHAVLVEVLKQSGEIERSLKKAWKGTKMSLCQRTA